eukprot:5462530-Alexandrium_andersonii.AAC.1
MSASLVGSEMCIRDREEYRKAQTVVAHVLRIKFAFMLSVPFKLAGIAHADVDKARHCGMD